MTFVDYLEEKINESDTPADLLSCFLAPGCPYQVSEPKSIEALLHAWWAYEYKRIRPGRLM